MSEGRTDGREATRSGEGKGRCEDVPTSAGEKWVAVGVSSLLIGKNRISDLGRSAGLRQPARARGSLRLPAAASS